MPAKVAELADAPDLGSGGRKALGVRLPPFAPQFLENLRGVARLTASFLRDTVRSLRSWRRTPGSALLAILALGLSGGAFLTLISLFNALFWRELPVSHPEELVGVSAIDGRTPEAGNVGIPVSLFASLDGT